MNEAVIYNTLNEIFCDIFINENIQLTPEMSAKDVSGWDSMKHIEIIMVIEERFSVNFSIKELDRMRTVGDFAALIESKKAL